MLRDGSLNLRHPLSRSLNHLALVTAILVMLTSSFDTFLVLTAGGNYRFCQLLVPILALLAALRVKLRGLLPVLGASFLLIWLAFQAIFIPVSEFWPKSAGYCLWLLLNIVMICSFVQLFSDHFETLKILLQGYACSFGVIAAFGIIQFMLPLLGYQAPFITQWWIPNRFARVSGFSYEPSYFATYLIIGFIFIGSLRRKHSKLLPRRAATVLYFSTAAGILVSSSRIGIFFLILDILITNLGVCIRSSRYLLKKSISRTEFHHLCRALLAIAALMVLSVLSFRFLEENPDTALLLLNGTGISDSAAHSVLQRENAFEDTLAVFIEHPVMGQSLGGVSAAIASLHGQTIRTFEDSKEFEGMNVFAEALAASGILGVIPFIAFLVVTVRKPLTLTNLVHPFYASTLRALVRSLVFAWAVLQFNQNLLRPYLWVHIGVLATVYAAALRSLTLAAKQHRAQPPLPEHDIPVAGNVPA